VAQLIQKSNFVFAGTLAKNLKLADTNRDHQLKDSMLTGFVASGAETVN